MNLHVSIWWFLKNSQVFGNGRCWNPGSENPKLWYFSVSAPRPPLSPEARALHVQGVGVHLQVGGAHQVSHICGHQGAQTHLRNKTKYVFWAPSDRWCLHWKLRDSWAEGGLRESFERAERELLESWNSAEWRGLILSTRRKQSQNLMMFINVYWQ